MQLCRRALDGVMPALLLGGSQRLGRLLKRLGFAKSVAFCRANRGFASCVLLRQLQKIEALIDAEAEA